MASKLLNLVALSSLAIMAVSFGPASTNALSTGHIHMNRHVDHAPIAKKKRESKRCKVRSSVIPVPLPTTKAPEPEPTTSSTKAAEKPKTTKAAEEPKPSPSDPKPPTSGGGSGGASGSGKFGKKGSKLCAAWGNGNDVQSLKTFKTDHMVGLYDWSPFKPQDADKFGWEFWPMLWGGSQDKIDQFNKQLAGEALGPIVLGFNEPNEPGQSNMDPWQAAAIWKQHIEPKRSKGYKFASPAMSSRPNGQKWMSDFLAACDGCHVDYQAVHWYDIGFEKFQKYITDYHNQLGLPILITEFADHNFNGGAQASMGEIFDFMTKALRWIDETDWILAACPFGIMKDLPDINQLNRLQSSGGQPTDLGWKVISNDY